jgi:hypothetical protein
MMRWRKTAALLLATGCALASGQAMAAKQIYRWVDEDGVVHFSSRPPDGAQAAVVDASSPDQPPEAAPAPAPAPAESAAETAGEEPELSYAEQRRQERESRRQQYLEKQRERDAQCENMRRQREWVEPSTRVLVQGEDGNPRRLNDEEREELLNEAITFLEENCD